MEHLQELVQLISPAKLRYGNFIGTNEDKVEQLYALLKEEEELPNEEARTRLFGGKNNQRNLLWRTKSRLQDRLVNSLLVLQQDDENVYKSSFIRAQKEVAACEMLRVEGQKKAFEQMAERLMKTARKYDFTSIVHFLAKQLKFHFSTVNVQPKKAAKYKQIQQTYRCYLDIEDEVEECYCELLLIIKTRKNFTNAQIQKARSLALHARELLQQRKNYWTVLLVSNIRTYYSQMINDHSKAAAVCQEAIQTFERLPYKVPGNAAFSLILKMIPGQILSQQFEAAEANIQKCLTRLEPGQINWAITKQAEVICLFHQKKYEQVLRIIENIEQYPQTYWSKESWTVYKAYARILTHQSLRLGKFLNEVPQFSKDTRGMNINILIIQTLEYIRRNEQNEVIDRTNALSQYIYRHLRQEDTVRSNSFIKMLIALEKGYFKPITVAKHARPYMLKLKNNPLHKSKQDFEVEIVPYEDLWGFIMEMLEQKQASSPLIPGVPR